MLMNLIFTDFSIILQLFGNFHFQLFCSLFCSHCNFACTLACQKPSASQHRMHNGPVPNSANRGFASHRNTPLCMQLRVCAEIATQRRVAISPRSGNRNTPPPFRKSQHTPVPEIATHRCAHRNPGGSGKQPEQWPSQPGKRNVAGDIVLWQGCGCLRLIPRCVLAIEMGFARHPADVLYRLLLGHRAKSARCACDASIPMISTSQRKRGSAHLKYNTI